MKRLILMRHAKSDWSAEGEDIDRPLNNRGRKSAAALGGWLRDQDILPDETLCSSAMRTRETLQLLDLPGKARFETALYLAEPIVMMDVLHSAEGDTVLMLAHNPGIAMLAESLLAEPPEAPEFHAYPTGSTLVAQFQTHSWNKVRERMGSMEHFTFPRALLP